MSHLLDLDWNSNDAVPFLGFVYVYMTWPLNPGNFKVWLQILSLVILQVPVFWNEFLSSTRVREIMNYYLKFKEKYIGKEDIPPAPNVLIIELVCPATPRNF